MNSLNTTSKARLKSQRIHNNLRFYLLTIRKHQVKDYVDKSMLDQIVGSLKLKHDTLHVLNHCYETFCKYEQLHFHGIVNISHNIYYKDNNSVDGYQIRWAPIYNMKGALKYIIKEAYNKYEQEYIHVINYYRYHYGFVN